MPPPPIMRRRSRRRRCRSRRPAPPAAAGAAAAAAAAAAATVEPARATRQPRAPTSPTTIIRPSALRAEEQGTTGFRLTVGANGRVTDCTVTSSSGRPRSITRPAGHAQPRPLHAGDATAAAADHDRHGHAAASPGVIPDRLMDDHRSTSRSFDMRRKLRQWQHQQHRRARLPKIRMASSAALEQGGVDRLGDLHHPRDHVGRLLVRLLRQAVRAAEDHQRGPPRPHHLLAVGQPARRRQQARQERRLSPDRRRRPASPRSSTPS